MPTNFPSVRPDLKEIHPRLQAEMEMARRKILELDQPEIRKVLDGFNGKTRAEVETWAKVAARQIARQCEGVTVKTYAGRALGSPRALCPLCGGSTSTANERGFALPLGLERHLLGTHNSYPCDIFAAALAIARWRADSAM